MKEEKICVCESCAWAIDGGCLFDHDAIESCDMYCTNEEAENYDELFWG